MRTTRRILLLLSALMAAGLMTAAFAQEAPYHVLREIKIGGEGGWDYVVADSRARHLYVSHATKVIVVDLDSEKIVGEISNTNGIHGVALAPEFGRGFTSNGRDATVTIFDLKTLAVIGTAKTGGNPDAIVYDPPTKRVFTFNRMRADATSTVIDAASGNVIKTITLGGRPEFAVTDEKGKIFVNLDDKNEVAVIDTKEMTVTQRWPLAPGEGPSGLAIDLKNRRLFSVCENEKMIVMNADNGKVMATLPIGKGTDGAAFDAATGFAFSSNGSDGTLTVVHEDAPDRFRVVANVKTMPGARTMTVDAKTHRLYLPTAQFGPPPASTPERPRSRPVAVPGTFMILVVGK